MNPFKEIKLFQKDSPGDIISFITGDFIGGDTDIKESDLDKTIPILPLRNTTIFPGSALPISVGRKKSLNLIRALGKSKKSISDSFVRKMQMLKILPPTTYTNWV